MHRVLVLQYFTLASLTALLSLLKLETAALTTSYLHDDADARLYLPGPHADAVEFFDPAAQA